jgi:hypothetical protein
MTTPPPPALSEMAITHTRWRGHHSYRTSQSQVETCPSNTSQHDRNPEGTCRVPPLQAEPPAWTLWTLSCSAPLARLVLGFLFIRSTDRSHAGLAKSIGAQRRVQERAGRRDRRRLLQARAMRLHAPVRVFGKASREVRERRPHSPDACTGTA